MAGTLNAGTLTDGNYTSDVTTLIRGGIKAWVLMDTTTSPITIKAHLNVTSITDSGVGNYRINFAKPMKNLNYGFMGSVLADSNGANVTIGVAMGGVYHTAPANKTLTSCNLRVGGNNAQYDSKEVSAIVVGD